MERAASRPRLSVRCIETEADFQALSSTWTKLHDQAHAVSVFTSWTWLSKWWHAFGSNAVGGRALRVLVAQDGANPIGILPLYLDPVRVYGVRAQVLRLVGTAGETHPDDLGPILAAGHETAAARALAQAALRLDEADALDVEDIDPRSPFAAALEEACREAGLPTEAGDSQRIRFIELPAKWDDYLASLKRERRARLRNAPKKLASEVPARFFTWTDGSRLDEAIDRLAELHRRRREALGDDDYAFSTRRYTDFHRAAMKACFAQDRLRLYCLEVDGKLSAMNYCYRFRDTIYVMQAGFDPDIAKLSPGIALMSFALQHAIGEGNRVYDFLRGEHRYKREYASGERATRYVRAARFTLGGMAYRTKRVLVPALKARLPRRRPASAE